MDLNKSQYEAVTTTEGYVRVIAGAGSGKTRALTNRFAYLVNDVGIPPGNILCVTFTNKAANEMRARIHKMIGDKDTGYINTFHGFCANVLQEESYVFQYPKSFLVLDNSDIDAMLTTIYEERGLTLRDMTFGNARDMIEMLKLVERPDYYKDIFDLSLEVLKEKYLNAESLKDIIFYGYLYQQKKCFGLDYNDLLIFTLYVFRVSEESKLKWQKRLMYIMVDEFQDIDKPQYELMRILAGYHKNLFVVGDPDQTIYTWRGADIGFLLNFDEDFPGTKTIMMMENYRSTPEIINVANSLISRNKKRTEKSLVPTRESKEKVVCYFAENPDDEADYIASSIVKLSEVGVEYRDVTILYRSHFLTRSIEQALMLAKIPYAIYSGVQLANDVSLYKALRDCVDDPIFKGTKAQDFLDLMDELSREVDIKSISELLADVITRSGYEETLRTEGSQERLDNLAELRQSVYDYEVTCGEETNLDSYLKHIALYTNADMEDTKNRVKLMTIHAAKGLEFPYVFICGLNEGVFPSQKTRTEDNMEEERRIAFVAYTRAMDGLFLTEAAGRNFDSSPKYPSRFLMEIDPHLLEMVKEPDETLIKEAADYIKLSEKYLRKEDSSELIPVGTRVKHMIFGEGTILSQDMDMQAYIIKFDSQRTERYISFKVKMSK